MQVQIQKWGNSLALRIPKSYALETKVREGTAIDISIKKGKLVLTPLKKQRYTLDSLLSEVTEHNIHGETNTGKPVGNEIW